MPDNDFSAERTALALHARLKAHEEHSKAFRDVVESIADTPADERTIRATLRFLVRAFDKGIADAG